MCIRDSHGTDLTKGLHVGAANHHRANSCADTDLAKGLHVG